MSGVESGGGATARDLADAHREMLANKQLQFDFSHYEPPKRPGWLDGLGHLFDAVAPVFNVLFWGVIILFGLAIVYVIVRHAMGVRLGERPGSGPRLNPDAEWRPTAEQARVLLADADALAGEGRYAEAAHMLLLRGVQDIRDRRPGVVRPALTSRDIAALEILPERARQAFGAIAQVVERSFFGGRDVGADDWGACRRAYERFATGEAV